MQNHQSYRSSYFSVQCVPNVITISGLCLCAVCMTVTHGCSARSHTHEDVDNQEAREIRIVARQFVVGVLLGRQDMDASAELCRGSGGALSTIRRVESYAKRRDEFLRKMSALFGEGAPAEFDGPQNALELPRVVDSPITEDWLARSPVVRESNAAYVWIDRRLCWLRCIDEGGKWFVDVDHFVREDSIRVYEILQATEKLRRCETILTRAGDRSFEEVIQLMRTKDELGSGEPINDVGVDDGESK